MKTKAMRWAWILIVLISFLQTLHYIYGHRIDGDVSQLLDRVILFETESKLLPYGPATSSGASGQVPGAFLSSAVALPTALFNSIYAPMVFLFLLHALSFLWLFQVFKKSLGGKALLLFALMWWLNPYRAAEVFMWNPGYMYVVAAAHLVTLYYLHQAVEPKYKLLWTTLHILVLAWGLQIHPSVLILGGLTLWLWWMRQVSPHWIGVGLGALLAALWLLPFLLEVLNNPDLLPKSRQDSEAHLFFGLTRVWPVLKGPWYWVNFGGFAPPSHLLNDTRFTWAGAWEVGLSGFWLGIKWIFGLIGVFLSLWVNYHFFKQRRGLFAFWRPLTHLQFQFLDYYAVGAMSVILFFVALSPATPQYWHILYTFPIALYPLLRAVDLNLMEHSKVWRWTLKPTAMVGLAVYFILFNFFGAQESRKHSVERSFHERYLEYRQTQTLPKSGIL